MKRPLASLSAWSALVASLWLMAEAPTLAGQLDTAERPAAASLVGLSAREALDEGDRLWGEDLRGDARQAWLTARDLAQDSDPAVVAQAQLRLLLVSGNLGLAVHGPRADRAIRDCSTRDPWCDVAIAERELMLRQLGLPWSEEVTTAALDRAEPGLAGPVLARRAWMGRVPVEELRQHEDELDSLGLVLARRGGWPAGPGTWVLGLGVAGASGQGAGAGLRLVHPDLGWTRNYLELEGSLTTRGAAALQARLVLPGRRTAFLASGLRAQHLVQDTWDADTQIGTERATIAVATVSPGLRLGSRASVWLGPLGRVDAVGDEVIQGHGAFGGLRWRPAEAWTLTLSSELSAVGSEHLGTRAELGWVHARGASGPAAQVLGQWVPWSTGPAWRLPTAGGGQVLRHGPAARFRDEALAAATFEWRQAVAGPLVIVPFLEGAWVDGLHGGGGLGLRLALPPRPHNTLRIDAGYGDGGFGLSLGWGERF